MYQNRQFWTEEKNNVSKKKLQHRRGTATTPSGMDWLRIISIGLCIFGIFVAGYMSWAELTDNETECSDAGKIDCSAVQNSAYASTYGLPVAVLGLLGYIGILGVLVLEDQIDILATYGRTLIIGMTLFGVVFSIYLSALEATVLDAWCQWCIMSAITILALLVIGGYRLYAFWQPLQR
jgi:uncharacterized membrane protein